MELSREAYQLIVQNVGRRSDLCSLALVSRPFQRAAERALYNTLLMDDPSITVDLCTVLAADNRLAVLVDALTVFAPSPNAEDDGGGGDDSREKGSGSPETFWDALGAALRQMTRLHFFNIHIDGNAAYARILHGCTFKLRSFHCDLAWDADLVAFLNTQDQLHDLYLADYPPSAPAPPPPPHPDARRTPPAPPLRAAALPALATLECSFIAAVAALAPGRPVARVKTCFSREDVPGKMAELRRLGAGLRRAAAAARVCSLDLADASYTEDFSLAVLGEASRRLPELRYLGTLVLPVGPERLQFFGLLMRLRRLRAVELEVSDWAPAPGPQALRALASELRLYCPSVTCVVFVQDFERTVVRVVNGVCAVDPGARADSVWRDVQSPRPRPRRVLQPIAAS